MLNNLKILLDATMNGNNNDKKKYDIYIFN